MGSKENQKNIKAIAVINTSKLMISLFNWFLVFFGIETPTKVFDEKESAIQWVKQLKKKNQRSTLEKQKV